MSVDAFNVAANGRRTHFYHQGVAAEMTPDHFDFSSTNAKILHLGLPGAHKAMDRPWRGEANGWVAVLRKARAAGLSANLELMTTRPSGSPSWPAVPAASRLSHRQRFRDRRAGGTRDAASRRLDRPGGGRARDRRCARARLHALGVGSFSRRRDRGRRATDRASRWARSPCRRAPIVGANGAGDAFAAGMLYGLHERWPIDECLQLGHACAAASMRAVSTTAGVGTVGECLALAKQWGFRPLALDA